MIATLLMTRAAALLEATVLEESITGEEPVGLPPVVEDTVGPPPVVEGTVGPPPIVEDTEDPSPNAPMMRAPRSELDAGGEEVVGFADVGVGEILVRGAKPVPEPVSIEVELDAVDVGISLVGTAADSWLRVPLKATVLEELTVGEETVDEPPNAPFMRAPRSELGSVAVVVGPADVGLVSGVFSKEFALDSMDVGISLVGTAADPWLRVPSEATVVKELTADGDTVGGEPSNAPIMRAPRSEFDLVGDVVVGFVNEGFVPRVFSKEFASDAMDVGISLVGAAADL